MFLCISTQKYYVILVQYFIHRHRSAITKLLGSGFRLSVASNMSAILFDAIITDQIFEKNHWILVFESSVQQYFMLIHT